MNGYNKEQQHQLGYVEMGATTKSSSSGTQWSRAKARQWGRKGEEGRWKGEKNNICEAKDFAVGKVPPTGQRAPSHLSLSLLPLLARYS